MLVALGKIQTFAKKWTPLIDIYFILENIKTWIRIIHNFDLEGCINAVLKLKY